MMESGTAGPSTQGAPEPDSPSLADSVGDMFGDFLPSSDPEVPDSESAGATPAADDPPTPDGSDGPAAAEHAGDAPADAAPTTSPEAPADDPLAGYAPLAYQVDGQGRTVEGIREHPEYGAIVDPEFLPTLKQRLSERDHLYEQSKAERERYQQLEQATTWPIQNAQGQTEYVTGAQALEAQRVFLARSYAVNQALAPILEGTADPKTLLAWNDETQSVVWNPAALKEMRDKIAFTAEQAAWKAQRAFDPYRGPSPSPVPADQPVAQLAPATIEQTATSLGITTLTPEDKQFLAGQFERYVRATTEAERKHDPTLGARIVDESFVALMKRVAQSRTDAATAVKSASSKAADNALRLKGAAPRPTTKPATSRQPAQPTRAQRASDAWDLAERAGAAALRQHR